MLEDIAAIRAYLPVFSVLWLLTLLLLYDYQQCTWGDISDAVSAVLPGVCGPLVSLQPQPWLSDHFAIALPMQTPHSLGLTCAAQRWAPDALTLSVHPPASLSSPEPWRVSHGPPNVDTATPGWVPPSGLLKPQLPVHASLVVSATLQPAGVFLLAWWLWTSSDSGNPANFFIIQCT